jgi:hypothetical protein
MEAAAMEAAAMEASAMAAAAMGAADHERETRRNPISRQHPIFSFLHIYIKIRNQFISRIINTESPFVGYIEQSVGTAISGKVLTRVPIIDNQRWTLEL